MSTTINATFAQQLERFGPGSQAARSSGKARLSLAEAEAYCKQLAISHYENFPLASCALPRQLHQHFYNVYAYCRWADDLGDEVHDAGESLRLLGWWREQLQQCYQGGKAECQHPVFVALRPTIDKFQIPIRPFDDLISAFEQDQTVFEYDTFVNLRDYCRRSADPVGRIVLHLCRQHSKQNVIWSDAICTGLQLANFWQDVARDYDIGRVYLPLEDRERSGYSQEDLKNRVTNDAFLKLMAFQVDRARDFLLHGLPLVEQMPGRLQVDIELFARGGLAILRKIGQIEYRVWDTRPVVRKIDFGHLLIASVGRAVLRKVGLCRIKPHPSPLALCDSPSEQTESAT